MKKILNQSGGDSRLETAEGAEESKKASFEEGETLESTPTGGASKGTNEESKVDTMLDQIDSIKLE